MPIDRAEQKLRDDLDIKAKIAFVGTDAAFAAHRSKVKAESEAKRGPSRLHESEWGRAWLNRQGRSV